LVDRIACDELLEILSSCVQETAAAGFGYPADMRSDDAVVALEEWVVYCRWLGEHYIESGTEYLTGVKCFSEVFRNYERTAAVVDDDDAILHLRDVLLVDDALCLRCEYAVEYDNIGIREYFVEFSVSECFANDGLIMIDIITEYVHTHSLSYL
jgi:hypothetical protein